MKKYFIILFLLISYVSFSNEKYTILDFRNDKTILDSVFNLIKGEKYKEAESVIKLHKSKINGAKFYLKAKIKYHLNKPFKSLLKQAFSLGYNYIDSSDFYFDNHLFIEKYINSIELEQKKSIQKKLFQDLIDRDQEYRKKHTDSIGSQVDKALLKEFDSLVNIYGFPTTPKYHFNSVGPIIILAHQDFSKTEYLMNYYKKVVNLCLENKESWQIADFILNQRFQWFGSKLRKEYITFDTLNILLDKDEKFDENQTLPFFYSMSSKLSVNGHYHLEIAVSNQQFKDEIQRLIYFFERELKIDEETLLKLKNMGFRMPKPLSDDCFSIEVNSKLKVNQLVYKFSI